MHSTIKFTAEISATKADFLDTTVYRNDDGSLWTDLFCKPTDTRSYLRYESSHPPHCKRSLPYSQFLCLRRICSREEDFLRHAHDMKSHFIGRGYPEKNLDDSLDRVKLLSRKTLLTPKPLTNPTTNTGSEEVTVYAITTYHPTQQDFRKIIDSNWNLLGSPRTQELFEVRIIFGHRRPKNLREHLVRAALKPPPTDADRLVLSQRAKDRECASHGRCKYCPRLDTSGTIKGNSDGRKFRSRVSVTCRSNNLIYAIECTRCGMHYVGQTKRRLMDRMVNHFATIRGEQMKYPVGHHFSRRNHHLGLEDVRLYVLEFCQTLPTDEFKQAREAVERKWQFRLLSNYPSGMNRDDALPTG